MTEDEGPPLPQPGASGGTTPTLEDVARKVGLHRSTVSLALRTHPRIPLPTRERIKAVADELGYRPNPLVAALMSYRANHRKPTWRGALGFITAARTAEAWKVSRAYSLIFEGAFARARALGYDLQPFWVRDPALPIKRFNAMLSTRNVPGVIAAPLFGCRTLPAINWSGLSAVAIGHSLSAPDLHRVSSDYFHSMITAVEHCLRHGFRRIGLVLDRSLDAQVDHLWLSAYLMQQRLHPELEPLEPLLTEGADVLPVLRPWLLREKPEVVVSLPGARVRDHLEKLGYRVPRDIGWVSLGCYDRKGPATGVFQNYELIGAAAIDFLVGMIHRGERGVPRQSHILHIKGVWVEGSTLVPEP